MMHRSRKMLRRRMDWVLAAGDVVAGGVSLLRRFAEAVGVVTVVAALTIALVPDVRQAVLEFGRDAFASDELLPQQPEAVAEADSNPQEVPLTESERSVAQYLARRYHVADQAVRSLVMAARDAGHETHLDPLLILSVMAVESSMNPFAQSPVGAQGLMQVMTTVHAERLADADAASALEPSVNIRVGSQILSDLVRRSGSLEQGLRLYVGAGNLPDDGGYAQRVLAEMGRLKTAASGDVTGALAAGLHADSRAAESSKVSAAGAAGRAGAPVSSS
jgi:soluble lytic murein transglycosylase-like protein